MQFEKTFLKIETQCRAMGKKLSLLPFVALRLECPKTTTFRCIYSIQILLSFDEKGLLKLEQEDLYKILMEKSPHSSRKKWLIVLLEPFKDNCFLAI